MQVILKRSRVTLGMVCLVGLLTGCANMSSGEQRTRSGAAIGTAAGAVLGTVLTGQPRTGAAISAAAGAAGGWLYDCHKTKEE